jgi:hypothetical protein
MDIFYGILFGIVGQIGSFFQLQGAVKYNWYEKYSWLIMAFGIPLSWVYMQYTNYIVRGFNGELWPSRLIGFGIGIIIFTLMSYVLFKEPLTIKTVICLILGFAIIGIQIFWK